MTEMPIRALLAVAGWSRTACEGTLPVASDWSDIDIVAAHNSTLRKQVNPIIGETWKKATQVDKDVLRDTALQHPELLAEVIKKYKAKGASAYDFDKDPEARIIWHALTRDLAGSTPLGLKLDKPLKAEQVKQVVDQICAKFKALVEDNRLSRLLYNDNKRPHREKTAQLAFFGIADAYCSANDFELSPEADAGVGPVDFKISGGYSSRCTVEMKLSSNPHLIEGFEKQLPAYEKAEKSIHSVYLVLRVTNSEHSIKKLRKIRDAAIAKGQRVPDLIVIDARLTEAASRGRALVDVSRRLPTLPPRLRKADDYREQGSRLEDDRSFSFIGVGGRRTDVLREPGRNYLGEFAQHLRPLSRSPSGA